MLSKPIRLRPSGDRSPRYTVHVRSENDHAVIDYDTRLFVWHRDGGRCRNCGSTEDLQFDHVIARSRGGSGRASNVELLCGSCNRRKSTSLIPARAQGEGPKRLEND
jgi:5-methylcytosine-specific restriction endonuclease McrA